MTMRFHTNAKLNLYLRVGERRPDGFHDIETVFQSVSLADELSFESLGEPRVDVNLVGAYIPTQANLVVRAAESLQRRTGTDQGAAIEMTKRIPLGGGLAGGSGNAAGTLLALNDLWELGLSEAQLLELALELGSDVPYCVRGGTCLATGRGEVLNSLPEPDRMWFVLGISHEPLSTAEVYRGYEPPGSAPEVPNLTDALNSSDIEAVGSALHNDLEIPALRLRPELRQKKEALEKAGALGALVSGSGPTVFGLCRDEAHAQGVAATVAPAFDRVEVVVSRPSIVERLS